MVRYRRAAPGAIFARPFRLTATAALAGWAAITAPAVAQSGSAGEWSLQASAGRVQAYPIAGVREPTHLALGIGYARGEARWFELLAGAPLGSGGVAWASAAAGTRLVATRRGPLELGTSLAADAYGFGGMQGGGGAAGSATPYATIRRGRLEAELGYAARLHHARAGGIGETRGVHGPVLRLAGRVAEGIVAGLEGQAPRTPEGSNVYLGTNLNLTRGRGWVGASAGSWLADSLPALSLGAELGAEIGRQWEVRLSGQRGFVDPLYPFAPRDAWSLAVRRPLWRAPSRPRPAGAGAPGRTTGTAVTERGPVEVRGRQVRFTLPADATPATQGAPEVVGDFTGWRPVPMRRSGARWVAEFRLAPGAYHFGFRNQGRWYLPRDVPGRASDGMGGEVGTLVVSGNVPM